MNWNTIYYSICYTAKKQHRHLLNINDPNFRPIKGHHIVPVCAGGKGDNDDWDHPNIAPLYARENYICHLILPKVYQDHKDIYEELKKEFDLILKMPMYPTNRNFERYVTLLYQNPMEAIKKFLRPI